MRFGDSFLAPNLQRAKIPRLKLRLSKRDGVGAAAAKEGEHHCSTSHRFLLIARSGRWLNFFIFLF